MGVFAKEIGITAGFTRAARKWRAACEPSVEAVEKGLEV